jgi:hypothetical protein
MTANKSAIFLAGLLWIAWLPGAAAAPYLGLDGDRASLDLNLADPALYQQATSGINFHLGDRFGMVGGEIGYSSNVAAGSNNGDALHLDQMTVDGLFYLPVMGNFDLLFDAGGAETNYGISVFGRNSYTDSAGKIKSSNGDVTVLGGNEFDWRAGAGLSFAYGDNFEIHAIGRYQPLSMQGSADKLLSLTIGVNFYL